MTLKIPIGTDNFGELINKGYSYVDKSLFVEGVIENRAKVQLILRPRRFGKTLNMSMLAHFFDCQNDNRHLFEGLQISKRPCFERLGSRPTVFVTFKDLTESNFGDFVISYRNMIKHLYRCYDYLLERLGPLDQDDFLVYARGTDEIPTLKKALQWLTQQLHRYHGKPVMLLIDEYDSPIHESYNHGYYQEAIDFMRGALTGVLKGNDSLDKAVLTGILRVSKESLFSGLNHVKIFSLLNKDFADKFGFTEAETSALIEQGDSGADMASVQRWYNGYKVGGEIIYNPWSILNYLDDVGEYCKPYWLNTSSNDLIYKLLLEAEPEVQGEIAELMKGLTIETRLQEEMAFRDLDGRALWTLLLYSGYLTLERESIVDEIKVYHLRIPNREVLWVFQETFMDWLGKGMGMSGMDDMLKALIAGKIDYFGQKLAALVAMVFSYYDTAGSTPERVYHAFVLGVLSHARAIYDIRSNRESGFGRYDVMMIPKDKDGRGVVIEFKAAETPKGLDAALDAGLAQIREQNYRAELEAQGIAMITEIAVAFCGKDVRIREAVG